MSEIHKNTVQQFAQALAARQFDELDKYLEHYVEKLENHQYVYKNIDEAREYYSKAPSAEWKILEFQRLDTNNDTLTARVAHNNQIYHTTYTFSSTAKIEKIHSVPEHHHTAH